MILIRCCYLVSIISVNSADITQNQYFNLQNTETCTNKTQMISTVKMKQRVSGCTMAPHRVKLKKSLFVQKVAGRAKKATFCPNIAPMAARAVFVSLFLPQKQLIFNFLVGNNFSESPLSQGGMKCATQISPLLNCRSQIILEQN